MASPSQISVSDFTCQILDKIVHFKIIKLDESLYVWIGTNPVLSNMAVAMPAKYGNLPSSSTLLCERTENTSQGLATKLAKRLNKQVFVSCSVPYDQQLSPLIEQKLGTELSKRI